MISSNYWRRWFLRPSYTILIGVVTIGRGFLICYICRWAYNRRTLHSPASTEAPSLHQPASRPPTSDNSPTDPALRANPFPEVTDPFCRLPLPTLFHQLEAVHLGDLMRLSVRPSARIPSSRLFSALYLRGVYRKFFFPRSNHS